MVKWTAKLWMVANRNNWLFLVCVCLSFRFGLPPLSLSSSSSFVRKKKSKKETVYYTSPLSSFSSYYQVVLVQDCI
jgi:hypothetical protein